MRKKIGKGNNHVFLIIEMIEGGYCTITRADLFLDERQKFSKGLIVVKGEALIEICVKPLSDMEILAEQCVYRSWSIATDQAKNLISNIEKDRSERLMYFNLGSSFLNSKTYNCLLSLKQPITF